MQIIAFKAKIIIIFRSLVPAVSGFISEILIFEESISTDRQYMSRRSEPG